MERLKEIAGPPRALWDFAQAIRQLSGRSKAGSQAVTGAGRKLWNNQTALYRAKENGRLRYSQPRRLCADPINYLPRRSQNIDL